MAQTKSWYQSKTIWGGIASALVAIALAFGIVIGEAEQSVIVDALVAGGAAIGAVLAIYGRVKAEGDIGTAK